MIAVQLIDSKSHLAVHQEDRHRLRFIRFAHDASNRP